MTTVGKTGGMCGDGCGARGLHSIDLHNKNIRNHYMFTTRKNVGAPLYECTCGLRGTHTLEEHDEEIRKVHGTIAFGPPVMAIHETPDPFLVAGLEAAVRFVTGDSAQVKTVMLAALSFANFLRKDGKIDGL